MILEDSQSWICREERVNLINHTKHAADVARLRQRLVAAGLTAPPWYQAPEVEHLSGAEL
jgi:hypothetical protein